MSEFSAFLAGLILGDTTPIPRTATKKPLHSNVALQDVAFCQALRNVIDGLESYVAAEHPSPAEFIKRILPEADFQEPLTDEEKKLIADNKEQTEAYVKWITSEIAASGESWCNLTATEMIWRDKAHTPDIDNLDDLFGDAILSKPLKKNGRVYEYNTTVPLSGLAKGFFDTIPARIIRAMCCQYSDDIVTKFGYQYDYTRFEHSHQADNCGNPAVWKLRQREVAYQLLLSKVPAFCKRPWSNLTCSLLAEAESVQHSSEPMNSGTALTREEERVAILNKCYSDKERAEALLIGAKHIKCTHSAKAHKISVYLFFIAAIASIVAFLCCVIFGNNISEWMTIFAMTAIVCVCWYVGNRIWYLRLSTRAEQYTIKILQDAYYSNIATEQAAQYQVLLDQLRTTDETT